LTKKKNNVLIVNILTPRDARLFKFLTTTFTNVLTIVAHAARVDLAMALFNLTKEQLLTNENRRIVAAHANPSALAQALIDLDLNEILNDANRRVVAAHAHPSNLAQALIHLDLNYILTDANRRVVAAHANPSALAQVLIDLDLNEILNHANRRAVAAHANPSALARALIELTRNEAANHAAEDANLFTIFISLLTKLFNICFVLFSNIITTLLHFVFWVTPELLLKEAGILTEVNRGVVSAYIARWCLVRSLTNLQQARILTQDNFDHVVIHNDPRVLASALTNLQQAQILTQANFFAVFGHSGFGIFVPRNDLRYFVRSLTILQQARILTQANFDLVVCHKCTDSLAGALYNLLKAQILTQANFNLIAVHEDYQCLAFAFIYLQNAQILTQANFNLIVAHEVPKYLAEALRLLSLTLMLTRANFELVATHNDTLHLASALFDLRNAQILTQANFTALLAPNHASLITKYASEHVWTRIPTHLLTEANYQRLLTAAEHANPMEELRRVTAEIIDPQQGQAARAALFNQAQSTHTASVHHSVSDSARKLMQSYGEGLKLEAKIAEIKAYVNALPNTVKNEAAKRCMARITEPHYSFTDASGVSTRQLLALAHIAIHDKAKRIGELADAKALFIEALYEIQRGYNLNDAGQDQGGVDLPICVAGTFNKLMEKLNGIHPDVEVVYITHEGASCKFSKLAQEHAKAYLRTLASPQNAVDYKRVKDLLDSIQNEGSLEPIWSKIQESVRDTLWEEFRQAYANNPQHPRFTAMINNGQYLNSPGLDEIEAQLMASPGREAYLAQQSRLSLGQNSFFSNRDTTNATQVLGYTNYGFYGLRKLI
jgi:ribosomal protein L12E/L44/L45/RPP1/RPP2